MITPTDFKAYFDRGPFVYGVALPSVRDKDILSAIGEMEAVINIDIYPIEIAELAQLYLTAHFLLLDLDAADSGGQAKFISGSRSADGISESSVIPDWMSQGDFAMYATTYYGQKFLALSKPYMDGAIFVVGGATMP